ncbi:MAG: glutamine-hydrolyzing GMP synthase [Dehalococcoidales bacterium]|nr:glutamine-hydrolyzing GMP synthase [Dehalococcoidales bacterium]
MNDRTEERFQEISHRISASDDLEISTYLQVAEARKALAEQEQELPTATKAPAARESVVIFDFGSQYSQLIARRVREWHVYCELLPPDAPYERVAALQPRGFILSGGPASVYDANAPKVPAYVLESGLPVLGICYGMQLLADQLAGSVVPATKREYGHATAYINDTSSPIFSGLPFSLSVWMSHGDKVSELPPGFEVLAYTDNSAITAMGRGNIVGLQFHPEVAHTPEGKNIIRNFLYEMCGCEGSWTAGSFVVDSLSQIREQVGNGKVICALSGGVDSTVTATLVHKAIGDQLTCIFVNNGLLRREEAERNINTFRRNLQMNLVYVDATDRFLGRLAGVVDPELKRRIIGEEFIRVFEAEARKIGDIDFLAQGTLYPDVIESATPETKAAAKIKTHHNVGGLPPNLKFSLIEPLRYLFKDEVRAVGLELGLPDEMINRQPFPGPGLAIRVIGEVTRERLETLRAADWVVMNEIKKAGLYRELWQSFAILTPLRSVGVMGDGRTYANVVAIRAVTSDDAMTAEWARLPYDLLARISNRIVNEVPGVNRVVYDISSKPPSTIEWE